MDIDPALQIEAHYPSDDAAQGNEDEAGEGTTGLEVVEVNIDVTDVHLPEEETNTSDSTDLK